MGPLRSNATMIARNAARPLDVHNTGIINDATQRALTEREVEMTVITFINYDLLKIYLYKTGIQLKMLLKKI